MEMIKPMTPNVFLACFKNRLIIPRMNDKPLKIVRNIKKTNSDPQDGPIVSYGNKVKQTHITHEVIPVITDIFPNIE